MSQALNASGYQDGKVVMDVTANTTKAGLHFSKGDTLDLFITTSSGNVAGNFDIAARNHLSSAFVPLTSQLAMTTAASPQAKHFVITEEWAEFQIIVSGLSGTDARARVAVQVADRG